MKKSSGFTLIELLVVISIIGVLSSVVLASVNTAREKGRLAAGIQYASSQYQAKGLSSGIAWHFDEGSGGTTLDASGNANTGTLGGGATWSSDVPYSSANNGSLLFDGTGYVNSPIGSPLGSAPGQAVSAGYTLMAWIKPSACANTALCMILSKSQPYLSLRGTPTGPKVEFKVTTNAFPPGTKPNTTLLSTNILSFDRWYLVAAVLDVSASTVSIYIDGKLDNSSATFSPVIAPGAVNSSYSFTVGRDPTTANPYTGYIDEVYFLNDVLAAKDIENFYAKTAGKYVAQNHN